MKRVGIFLGASPRSGGMFQYTQSIVEAALHFNNDLVNVVVVYEKLDWVPFLKRLRISGHHLKYGNVGIKIANVLMLLQVPGRLSRCIGSVCNPLIRELKSYQCDLWVFPAQDSLSWQIPGIKSVGVIHDLMHRYQRMFPEVGLPLRFMVREHRFSSIAKHCEVVLVDSCIGRLHVIESYPVNPNKVKPLKYIAPSYIQVRKNSGNYSSKNRLPKKYIFYPAQFWPHKNHKRLLEAVSILASTHSDLVLVLTGDKGKHYRRIFNYAKQLEILDRVEFLGYVQDDDLMEIFKGAQALIYPSLFGPTNIPPLEAFAIGCPVAVSNIYGMPEQCKDAALYFDPLDSHAIADVISQLWMDERLVAKMSKKSLEKSLEYTQDKFNEHFRKIIFEALKLP